MGQHALYFGTHIPLICFMGGEIYSLGMAMRRVLDRRKPGTAFIFVCLLLPRILSAWYNIIHDCDEVYNYWEPLHFLLYGHGMQTWEYR